MIHRRRSAAMISRGALLLALACNDADPNRGQPKRVRLCDATCAPLKADPTAEVQLRFGCRTRID